MAGACLQCFLYDSLCCVAFTGTDVLKAQPSRALALKAIVAKMEANNVHR